jgi:hypothetical protein
MAQQTAAVDWIIQQLPPNYRKNADWYKIFKQGKEMFQQQIESAWKRGDGEHDKVADKLAKQYYTETYGK